jgi:MFS transporter, OPA family, glycerol-3-phosphate transporter
MTTTDLSGDALNIAHPPGFRPRRGLNWAFLGLLYTSYYMCRYNFPIANKAIATEFGFSKAQMGWIITTNLFAYACGQIINGLLTDRMGGKKAMMIGAAGTIVMNFAFGAASFWGMLWLFVALWGLNGYIQSFGAPGMVKINTAWFPRRERGRFAGIFGFMINLGRFGIFKLGPALLAGFTVFGLMKIPPLHWRWLFWAPSIICFFVAIGMWIFVKESPEEAGFMHLDPSKRPIVNLPPRSADGTLEYATAATPIDAGTRADFAIVLRTILTNPAVWITAGAYACTGGVRQAVDQWFPRYMQDVHSMSMESAQFQWLGFLIPFVASVGSLSSGYISDLFFESRRAPVAAFLYFLETIIILAAAQFHSANAAIVFFVLISLTANSTHSLLGTAAAMDLGGRKMSGFSSGLIDSFQYFGGSLAGYLLGTIIDHTGWGSYFYFMAPFGVVGGLLMTFYGHELTLKSGAH